MTKKPDSRRLGVTLVFALTMTSCAMPASVRSYAPPGKLQSQLAQEDAYCTQQVRGVPLGMHDNEYGLCMTRFGNDVQFANGTFLAGYVPPPIPRYSPAPPQMESADYTRPYLPSPESIAAPSDDQIAMPVQSDAPNSFAPSQDQVRQALSDAAWMAGKDCLLAYAQAKYSGKEDEFSSASCLTRNFLANLALSAFKGAAYVEICRQPQYLQSILGADKSQSLASVIGCGSTVSSTYPAETVAIPSALAGSSDGRRIYRY